MILHFIIFPFQIYETIRIEDPSQINLAEIFTLRNWNLEEPCCFFSNEEKAFLDPYLSLSQSPITLEDHIIVFTALSSS